VEVDGATIAVERLCRAGKAPTGGLVSLVGVAVADPQRILVGCEGVRPAPALALAARAIGPLTSPESAAGAPADPDAGPFAGRRILAVGLLVAGMAIVGIGVLVARRQPPDDPDDAEEHSEPAVEPVPVPPQLTLVRVPNEHGP
jgi:hypothetical protein